MRPNSFAVNILAPYGCCHESKWSHILEGALGGAEDGWGQLRLRRAGEEQDGASVVVTATQE